MSTTQVPVRRAAVATGLLFAGNGVLFATWVTRIPAMRNQVDASTAELGVALLCLALGSLLTMPVSGALCRRWGAAAVCAATLTWCAVALPMVALTTSPVALSAALFVLSLGYGSWDVAMNVHGHYVEHAARRVFMPRFHAAWSAGSLAGSAVGVVVAAQAVPPVLHFTGASALVAVVGVVATRAFLPARRETDTHHDDRHRRTGITVPLLLLGLLTMCATLGEGAAADWLALFLVDERGASQALGAAGFTAFTVMMLLGRAAGTNVVERLGRVRALRLAGVVTAAGVGLLLLTSSPTVAFGGALCWGLGISIVFPTSMSAAGDSGHNAESAIAVVSTIGYGGFLLGPPLVGFLAHGIGLGSALWVVALWGLGVVALAGVARQSRDAPHRSVTG